MKDRIIQFLAAEKISPAEFADKIGVQRSSMSHILNGRNYPSASFLQKMLQAYPNMNPRWLMIGDGTMNMPSASAVTEIADTDFPVEEPVTEAQTVLFHDQEAENLIPSVPEVRNSPVITDTHGHSLDSGSKPPSESVFDQSSPASGRSEEREKVPIQSHQALPEIPEPSNGKEIEQVLFFYKDKTFRIYRPS